MNILSQVPELNRYLESLGRITHAMNEQCNFAKLAASQAVCILAQSSCYIQAFGGNGEHICVVESSRVLSGNLRVVESIVKGILRQRCQPYEPRSMAEFTHQAWHTQACADDWRQRLASRCSY